MLRLGDGQKLLWQLHQSVQWCVSQIGLWDRYRHSSHLEQLIPRLPERFQEYRNLYVQGFLLMRVPDRVHCVVVMNVVEKQLQFGSHFLNFRHRILKNAVQLKW